MKDSLATGFLFHTPTGPFNFFFHQAYGPNIFIYKMTKKTLQNTYTHIQTFATIDPYKDYPQWCSWYI